MKIMRKYLYSLYFVVVYIIYVLFDYFRDGVFHLVANGVQSLCLVLFFIFFDWALNDKKKENNKAD
jgi:hypothetical protein